MLKKIRTILALVFFIGITLLFLDFTGTAHRWLSWMAKVQFLPAVLALNALVVIALVVLTIVFGRIYCSVICPLGVFQDLIARLGKRAKKNRYTYSRPLTWLRYSVLAVFVVALAAGVGTIVQLLAPYSAFGRIATTIFQPLWKLCNNGLAAIAERIDSYAFYSVDVLLPSFGAVLAIAVLTVLILFPLAWRNGRTYCNTICPVGTVLGYLSKFSLLKIQFDTDKCKNCSLCTKNCKASCIDYKSHTVDYTRCVACGNCLESCKFGALSYGLAKKSRQADTSQKTTDTARRAFLMGGAIVAADTALAQAGKKVDGGLAVIEDKVVPRRKQPLTPPGSISAKNMAQHCTACQLCVAQCPNDVLRPSGNLLTLMQPTMSYERGYCRPECNRCSQVCPAGAIKPIGLDDKSAIQIGHAVWVKENCVVLNDGVACGNCARHCPSGAIMMVPSNPDDDLSPMVPAVDAAKCIGCGACEYVCPARPLGAIYVEGHEVHKII